MGKRQRNPYANWSEYRYGSVNKRPITLAGQKKTPVFSKDRRKHVLGQVMDLMRDWRQSPFEYEGPVRTGVRSALCLQGHGWQRSDDEAASLVSDSLRQLGATRPTWEQGQRFYGDPRENCRWCYGPIAEEDMTGNRSRLFCSDVCARSAYVNWDLKGNERGNAMAGEAYRAAYREKLPSRSCEHCGKSFKPASENARSKYCSTRCTGEAQRMTIPERACLKCGTTFRPPGTQPDMKYCKRKCYEASKRIHQPRRCQQCSLTFIPRRDDQAFCSQACAHRERATREVECVCEYCFEHFRAKQANARFCSEECSQFARRVVAGRVKRISPPVFDYVFRMAA